MTRKATAANSQSLQSKSRRRPSAVVSIAADCGLPAVENHLRLLLCWDLRLG